LGLANWRSHKQPSFVCIKNTFKPKFTKKEPFQAHKK
jgi:hypothetical protein